MRLAYEAGAPFLFGTSAGGILWSVLQSAVSINLVLMFFNLIPLPPLDGFGIITDFQAGQKTVVWTVLSAGTDVSYDYHSVPSDFLCDFAGCIMDLFTDHEYIFLMIHKGPVPEKRPAEFRRVKSAFRMKSLCVSDWNFRRAGK